MTVKSKQFVALPDETYYGLWCGWTVTIPFVTGQDQEEDMEIPVSQGTKTNDAVFIKINVVDHQFTFEEDGND